MSDSLSPCNAGMRSVHKEQHAVITLMLSRQSALVICPEAAQPLYFLRSSICAASLTLTSPVIPAIQTILLTPTDNLARALYRPLEGYSRFCELGARICSGPSGHVSVATSPTPGDCPDASQPSARRDGGLSARGRTNPQLLVGTPEGVLAHLRSKMAPALANAVLLVVCHAHSVFDGGERELELAAVAHHVCPSQARSAPPPPHSPFPRRKLHTLFAAAHLFLRCVQATRTSGAQCTVCCPDGAALIGDPEVGSRGSLHDSRKTARARGVSCMCL